MLTIKFTDARSAVEKLEEVLGIPLR